MAKRIRGFETRIFELLDGNLDKFMIQAEKSVYLNIYSKINQLMSLKMFNINRLQLTYALIVLISLLPLFFALSIKILIWIIVVLVLALIGYFVTSAFLGGLVLFYHRISVFKSGEYLLNLLYKWHIVLILYVILLIICIYLDRKKKLNLDLSLRKISSYIGIILIFIFLQPYLILIGDNSALIMVSVQSSEELPPPANLGQFKWNTDRNAAENQPTADKMESELKPIFYLLGSQIAVEPNGLSSGYKYNVYFRGFLTYQWPLALGIIQQNHFVEGVKKFGLFKKPYHGY